MDNYRNRGMAVETAEVPNGDLSLLNVLLLEDDPLDAELCLAQLKRAGFNVRVDAVDSEESFARKLESHDYDIILADYGLRSWNGREAFLFLKHSGKDIPFIIVTGTLGDEAAVDLIKDGVTDYVMKERLIRLPSAIRRALKESATRKKGKQVQEALRRSESRLHRLLESSIIGIGIATAEGKLLDANDALLKLLGYTREELASGTLRWNEMTPPEYRKADLQLLEQLQGRGVAAASEKELIRKDGSRVAVLIGGITLATEEGDIEAVSFVVDISERKLLEQQLRHAQKMESIGQLAGGIAHDFNNLLNVIIGYSDLVVEIAQEDSPTHVYANEIRNAGERAASLTRQLLAFSRQQVMQTKVLDLNAVVLGTEAMLRRLIGERVELLTALDPSLGSVKADPGQVEQVIMNLAVNARDAMPQGGKLIIATSNVELPDMHSSQHPALPAGRYILLRITDTGIGMDEQTKAHIFEPFFTTKGVGKGTGLGLSTVYGIVKQSGGFIRIYSEPNAGAVFETYLPRIDQTVPLVSPEKRKRPLAQGSETVLLVEDEESVRKLACTILHQSGYTVLEAHSGAHAVQVVRQHNGPIHLLLSDVMMPDINGPALSEALSPLHPEMRVLYVSGYSRSLLSQDGAMGTTKLLQKPFSKDALLEKVRDVLDAPAQQAPSECSDTE